MHKWLICYADGSTFSSDDGRPCDAPTGGVEVVFNADAAVGFKVEPSRVGLWGWRDDYGWVGFRTESGYWEYLFQSGILKYLLFGRTMIDNEWFEFQKEAGEKALGLKKSGWWKIEREEIMP